MILIVEDDAQMRRYLSTTMASHGFDTAEASTLAEATHALRSSEPQLVLLDLGLPDGDGLDLLRTMRLTASTGMPSERARASSG